MKHLQHHNEFITDNNLTYVKPAVIQGKQHYVCSENTLIISVEEIEAKAYVFYSDTIRYDTNEFRFYLFYVVSGRGKMCDRKYWRKLQKYIELNELAKFRSCVKRHSVDVIGLLDEHGNSLLHLSCKHGCEVILRYKL